MSRAYAIVRLLQHGPLKSREIVAIGGAGWTEREVSVSLLRLQRTGRISAPHRGTYQLRMHVDEALRGLQSSSSNPFASPRLRAGTAGPMEGVQPGMHGLRVPIPVVHPAPGNRREGEAIQIASGAGSLDVVRALGAGTAGRGEAHPQGMEGVGT